MSYFLSVTSQASRYPRQRVTNPFSTATKRVGGRTSPGLGHAATGHLRESMGLALREGRGL